MRDLVPGFLTLAQGSNRSNKGEMDNFLKHFKDDIVPLHEKIGVPIVGTWVNGRRTNSSGSEPCFLTVVCCLTPFPTTDAHRYGLSAFGEAVR
jgi:hypothetical protein